MSRLPDLVGQLPGFMLRNGFWMRECDFLQLALQRAPDGRGTICQAGILDPFAREKQGPFFVQALTLEGGDELRTTRLPWRDGDVSGIAKKLTGESNLGQVVARWIEAPASFLEFAIHVIEQWHERAAEGPSGLFGWLAKKGVKTPPLASYVLSLLFFHAGDFEQSLRHLERFRGVLSPGELDQREWREAHFRALTEKRA